MQGRAEDACRADARQGRQLRRLTNAASPLLGQRSLAIPGSLNFSLISRIAIGQYLPRKTVSNAKAEIVRFAKNKSIFFGENIECA